MLRKKNCSWKGFLEMLRKKNCPCFFSRTTRHQHPPGRRPPNHPHPQQISTSRCWVRHAKKHQTSIEKVTNTDSALNLKKVAHIQFWNIFLYHCAPYSSLLVSVTNSSHFNCDGSLLFVLCILGVGFGNEQLDELDSDLKFSHQQCPSPFERLSWT